MAKIEPAPATRNGIVWRMVAGLCAGWAALRERIAALKPCRVAVLMVLASAAFLILAPQGQDVVRALAERQSSHRDDWQRVFFFAATLAWSLYAWYWARVMLFLRFPGVPEYARHLQRIRTWAPRLIGFVATLGVAYALYRASRGYAPDEHGEVRELLRAYALWCLAGSVAFLAAVSARRTVSRVAYERLQHVHVLQNRLAAPVVNLLNVRRSEEEAYGTLGFAELSALTRALLYAALSVAVLLFLLFVMALQAAAPVIGSAAIVLLAATGWIAVGSMLDLAGMRLRVPVFTTLLLLAVVFSLWNDNHAVRTVEGPQPEARPHEDLRAALRAWMTRQEYRPAGARDRYPLYLADAEGGGIRAAYWTASVLGRIQDENPCFADQLFSLSGVSGGSLGAAVFVALLAEQRAADGRSRCRTDRAAPGRIEFMRTAQQILGQDFLSPVVASMLYPDLVQRLLPWPFERLDRALALEQAWERAWRAARGTDRFAQPFDELWRDQAAWLPALFLNATWVETGKRAIASNVRIVPRGPGAIEDFVDTEDVVHFFAPRRLPLSTAVHLSARFTFVSPAGTLVKDGRVYGRVVDGGYFENSGATTTLEILKTIDQLAAEDEQWARVEPIVIHISNEPVDPAAGPDTLAAAPDHPLIAPRRLLNEVRSPFLTLLNTRGARGTYARETVRFHVGPSNFLQFGLCRRATNFPLGWVLSQGTRDRMDIQLLTAPCVTAQGAVIFDNPANLETIADRLARNR